MYENETRQEIQKRMLERVEADLDKREGSIIYDTIAPVAAELELLYAQLEYFIQNTFADKAERNYLVERAKERGITPKESTYAVVKGDFYPPQTEIPIGARFSCDGLNYKIIQKVTDGQYLMQCESKGIQGNKSTGRLLPIDFNQNLMHASVLEVTIPAVDEEDTEVFRDRFLASFDLQSYGGNISDYKSKIENIPGVGGVKVYPVWNGGGTVKIVFCTSDYTKPAKEFVDQVQEMLDPIPFRQKGVGIAPIGHCVTVVGVEEKKIHIRTKITPKQGVNVDDLKPLVKKAIEEYFNRLNREWKFTQTVSTKQFENNGIVLRIAHIESVILDIPGVLDIEKTELNGGRQNFEIGVDEIAVLGWVLYV